MVYIKDEGSVFDASLEDVLRLREAHLKEGPRIHPEQLNQKIDQIDDRTVINSWEQDMQGQRIRTRAKLTSYAPVGLAIEILEGPLAGSRFFNYYTPIGPKKTGVTVVGEFKSSMMPDSQLKPAVEAFLQKAFEEDAAYLRKMR